VRRLIVPALLVATALHLQCGLFAPREGDPPLDTQTNLLSFGDILSNGTSEEFPKLNYEDMLGDGFVYVSSYDLAHPFGRTDEIARLRLIEQTYLNSARQFTVAVAWEPDTSMPHTSTLNKMDTVSLYRVYAVTSPQLPDTLRGGATFRLVYEDIRNAWTIVYWKDTPEVEPGFFNPGFVDAPLAL
jgi:hypothetical protein